MLNLETITNIDEMVEQSGYTALNLAKNYPKVKVPSGTVAMFFDIKVKSLLRVDEEGLVHYFSLKSKEWTKAKPIASLGYWMAFRNKQLRPVVF